MIYAFTLITLALLALIVYLVRREAERLDAVLTVNRTEVKNLVDQIVLLKVDPPMAAIQAMPEHTGQAAHISSFDDDALAEYELERARLVNDTRSFIEAQDSAPVAS